MHPYEAVFFDPKECHVCGEGEAHANHSDDHPYYGDKEYAAETKGELTHLYHEKHEEVL